MNNPRIFHLRLSAGAVAVAWLLTGCGLAETAAVTATQAEAAAAQVKQGKEMQEKVERDIAAANQAAADARAQVEAANE